MIKKTIIAATTAAMLFAGGVSQAATVQELAKYAGIPASDISAAMKQAKYQQKIIDAMTRPYEAKPWWQYRNAFISKSRIDAGANFYIQNEATLKKAYEEYGVPPEIVCSIIGVETFFGQSMGTWKVLDALYTLGFRYPPRQDYFSKEFANYVKLAKREGWKLTSIKGSYAGAMGLGQFMPYSYLTFAVDFDGDGKINLFHNVKDAIGSVANYFKEHGWVRDQPVYYPAYATKNPASLIKKEWNTTARELYDNGISTKEMIPGNEKVRLFKFDLRGGKVGYGVGLNNFNAIMKYNKSQLYARVVFELSEFIREAYEKKKGVKVSQR